MDVFIHFLSRIMVVMGITFNIIWIAKEIQVRLACKLFLLLFSPCLCARQVGTIMLSSIVKIFLESIPFLTGFKVTLELAHGIFISDFGISMGLFLHILRPFLFLPLLMIKNIEQSVNNKTRHRHL